MMEAQEIKPIKQPCDKESKLFAVVDGIEYYLWAHEGGFCFWRYFNGMYGNRIFTPTHTKESVLDVWNGNYLTWGGPVSVPVGEKKFTMQEKNTPAQCVVDLFNDAQEKEDARRKQNEQKD